MRGAKAWNGGHRKGRVLEPSERWFSWSYGLSIKALPAILPVQYYVDGRVLAICLGQNEIASSAIDDTVVAFAADEIDSQTRTGWSVQVQGKCRLPHTLGITVDCGQPEPRTIVHLAPVNITGHRIRLCPFGSPMAGLM